LACDKPTPFKMNLALEIWMDQKRNSEILPSNFLLSFVIMKGPMKLGASLRYTQFPTSKLNYIHLWLA
jgi:hypothetical protein